MGCPRDRGERKCKKMIATSVESRRMSSSRLGLRRSVAACTVEGGLDSQEGRERHTEEEGKNNLLTSNEANARVFI